MITCPASHPDAAPLAKRLLTLPCAAILRYPLGDPPSAPTPANPVTVIIHRQPIRVASDAQIAVSDLFRRHRRLSNGLVDDIIAAGLLQHCGYLSSATPDGPLIFRRHADATVRVFGVAWARAQIGQPSHADPHTEYASSIGAQYDEAIQSGQPVYNHLVIQGLSTPVIYSHLLVGFRSPAGQQALLTCISRSG